MARVLRLIDARSTRSVSLAELSACAGVSRRVLHAMFHETFGVSPVRYVRLRKLQMVRATLILGDADGLTVARTCARLGLSDCGRVAGDYRRLFGEYPSETLARRFARKGTATPPTA